MNTLQRVKELAGHCGAVYAVCTHDRKVFSGSYDSTIKVWNLDNFRCIQTLKRHTSSVEVIDTILLLSFYSLIMQTQALISSGDSVISASSDNSIKVPNHLPSYFPVS